MRGPPTERRRKRCGTDAHADGSDGEHGTPAVRRIVDLGAESRAQLAQQPLQRRALDQIRVALEEWRPARVDVINYRKDGVPYVVSLRITPVRTDGRPSFFVAIEDDATRTWLLRTQRG